MRTREGCRRSHSPMRGSCKGTGMTTESLVYVRLHKEPSYSAKAEYPVRRDLSRPSLTPRSTGSSAFADADGLNMRAPSRDTLRPSCANSFRPKIEGAGKTGRAPHPRSHVQGWNSKTHTSIQVQRKQSGLPCAMVLRLISCSPRRDRACLPPSPPRSVLLRNLTPATGASGPHD
jgi:hypothetical protein